MVWLTGGGGQAARMSDCMPLRTREVDVQAFVAWRMCHGAVGYMGLSSAFRRAKQMRTNANAIVAATSDPEETPPVRLHDRAA
eukprot:5552667-Pyramimonas_sp.AAC.1